MTESSSDKGQPGWWGGSQGGQGWWGGSPGWWSSGQGGQNWWGGQPGWWGGQGGQGGQNWWGGQPGWWGGQGGQGGQNWWGGQPGWWGGQGGQGGQNWWGGQPGWWGGQGGQGGQNWWGGQPGWWSGGQSGFFAGSPASGGGAGSITAPGPFTGRGPQGYRRPDERVYEEACELLTHAGNIDAAGVTVQVKNGAVTLTGSVPDKFQKRAAQDLVEMVPGVSSVNDQLAVKQTEQSQSPEMAGAGSR
jgi:hypothetical protein